jgi:hypothetical protein
MVCRGVGGAGLAVLVGLATGSACASGGDDSSAATGDAAADGTNRRDGSPGSSDGAGAADAGGTYPDAALDADDAGSASDSSSPLDSSSPRDSAPPTDSGPGFDSGDAGPSDAGGPEGSDGADAGPPPTGIVVLYRVEDSASQSAYVGCELSVANMGTASPALTDLKVRYYYTDDVHVAPQMTINWSHVSTSGADAPLSVAYSVVPMQPAATEADTYIEFAFSGSHPALAPGESAVFSWQMQGPNPASNVYTQTNDYSFDASKTSLTAWSHVVSLQSGAVAWGTPP